MNFNIENILELLERTPRVLEALLNDLSDYWIKANAGDKTWNPFDILGHLIHGEKTDWIARLNVILSDSEEREFAPFNRYAQFEESKGKSINDLIEEFKFKRNENLEFVKSLDLTDKEFNRTGIHPVFGEVTLRQLLSTWMSHDLDHLFQISRMMAVQLKQDVGPWKQYIRILNINESSY
jgi:hypothetical protein